MRRRRRRRGVARSLWHVGGPCAAPRTAARPSCCSVDGPCPPVRQVQLAEEEQARKEEGAGESTAVELGAGAAGDRGGALASVATHRGKGGAAGATGGADTGAETGSVGGGRRPVNAAFNSPAAGAAGGGSGRIGTASAAAAASPLPDDDAGSAAAAAAAGAAAGAAAALVPAAGSAGSSPEESRHSVGRRTSREAADE